MIRSVVFIILFNLSTFFQIIFWMPVFFFLKPEDGWKVPKLWAWNSLWLQHALIGTRYDFRGVENIPKNKGLLIAAKHQSTWETYTLLPFMTLPSYIVKRELMLLPLFGWFAMKMNVIGVNRGKRSKALSEMTQVASKQYDEGRQIVIYPEGTRKKAYDPPNYKYGITHMYVNMKADVLPVALNSGLFWPRNGMKLNAGTCIVEFLPLIKTGLTQEEFASKLETVIEEKTTELLAEAEADPEYQASL